MTLNVIPLSMEIESVSVFKTHVLSVILALVFVISIAKWILPAILSFLSKKEEKRFLEVEAEKEILKESIKRLVERQQIMNEAIVEGLTNVNKSMIEIKNLISKNLKTIIKTVVFLAALTGSACDSDTVTVYKFKKPEVAQKIDAGNSYEVSKDKEKNIPNIMPPAKDDKDSFIKTKTCSPACVPPKSECNDRTGKCEGSASTSSIDFMEVRRHGTFDPFTETYEVLVEGRK